LIRIVLALLDLIGYDACILTSTLVDGAFVPSPLAFRFELVAAAAQLSDGLLGEKLFQRPLLDILLLVLLQLCDELNRTLKNRALVLLAPWHNLGKFIDAFVDSLPTTSLHWRVLV
jgi:hypothetical protein